MFILLGLMFDAERVIQIDERLVELLTNYDLKNFKELRGKVEKDKKIEVTKKIVKILSENKVEVLSVILGKSALRNKKDQSEVYQGAITFITERFFVNLNNEKTPGMIILDSINEKKEQIQLATKFNEYISKESYKYKMWDIPFRKRIYPAITFMNDDHSVIHQIADLVVLALKTGFCKQLEESKKNGRDIEKMPEYNPYLAEYWPLFKRNNGKIEGVGIKIWW